MDNLELTQKIFDLVKMEIAKSNWTAVSSGPKPLILTAAHGTSCHPAYERLGGICALLQGYDIDYDKISCVIMYDLSLENLFKLSSGCADNAYLLIAVRALLEGKPVYIIREQIDLLKFAQTGGPYYDMLYENINKLLGCGINIVSETEIDDAINCCKTRARAATGGSDCKCGSVYAPEGKKVLVESDVKQARVNGVCELIIEPKTIVTSLASEYAFKMGIMITRRLRGD